MKFKKKKSFSSSQIVACDETYDEANRHISATFHVKSNKSD
jgi:hypothetical protein